MRGHPSYSSLSTYKRCPAAFQIGYGEPLPVLSDDAQKWLAQHPLAEWLADAPADLSERLTEKVTFATDPDPGLSVEAMENGKEAHEAIRVYGEHCFAQKRKVDGDEGRRIAAGYDEPVRSLLEGFFEDWRWDWGSTVVEGIAPVEQHLKATLRNGMIFSGHIDLLQKYEGAGSVELDPFGDADSQEGDDNKWVVTDFKSHVYGDFHPTIAPWQHELYCALTQANWPEAQVFEARIHILDRHQHAPGPWLMGGNLNYILHDVSCLCDRIEADTEREPKCGEACLGCTYVMACPCRDAQTRKSVCGDTPEGRFKDILFQTAELAAQKKLLKAYGKANGPVYTDGQEWDGKADKLLVPRSPATLDQDLDAFGLTRYDLSSGITKGQIEKTAKKMDDEQRVLFMDKWEEIAGSVKWAARKVPKAGLVTVGEAEDTSADSQDD